MKKLWILAGAMIVITVAGHAQELQIGPRIGMGFFSHYGDADDQFTPGAVLGAAFNIPLCDDFSLQPEINFTQRGGRVDISNPFNPNNFYHFNQNYLGIGVNGRYNLDFTDRMGMYGEFGPELSFWTCGNYRDRSNRNKYDFGDNDGRVDLGLNIGFGGSFDLPCGELLFGPRLYLGLIDTYKEDNNLPGNLDYSRRNIGISLNAAYMFDIGPKQDEL